MGQASYAASYRRDVCDLKPHICLMLIEITLSAMSAENIVKVQPIPTARIAGPTAAVPAAPSRQRTMFRAAVAEALRSR
ncbi:hypothetical protein KCV00_g294, partial [Aureobasidium melanogenum]